MSVRNQLDEQARPSRRAVVRTAAWTLPVVSVAATAPAFAASTCANPRTYALDWGTTAYTHTGNTSYARIPSSTTGAADIYVHFEAIFRGSGAGDGALSTGESRNLSVPTATAGTDTTRDPAITNLGGLGSGGKGVRLQQVSPIGYDNRQDVVVTFRSGTSTNSSLVNVQGLSFWIVDIDAITTSPYSDRVSLTSGVSYGALPDTAILGGGTQGNPWRNTNTNTNQSENSAGARVRISYEDDYAYRLSTFTLSYWTTTGATAPATGQYHRIFLSDFAFRTCP